MGDDSDPDPRETGREPTMEEILASIRRIIAEEDDAARAEETADADMLDENGEPFEAARSDVLELAEQRAAEEAAAAAAGAGRTGTTADLEAMVRDMLRPMLKAWLDANLPDMVNDMVAREIARITRK